MTSSITPKGLWVRVFGGWGVGSRVRLGGGGWTERTEKARFVPKSRLSNRADTRPSCGSRCKQRLTDSGQQVLKKSSMPLPAHTPPPLPPRANTTLPAHTLQAATTGVPFQKDAFGVA